MWSKYLISALLSIPIASNYSIKCLELRYLSSLTIDKLLNSIGIIALSNGYNSKLNSKVEVRFVNGRKW